VALHEDLVEALQLIADPKERQQQQAILEKYPQFGEGWLRQSDYSKKQTQLQKERETFETQAATQKAEHERWEKWYNENKPEYDRVFDENKTLKAAEVELKKQLAERPAAEGELDEAALQAKLEQLAASKGFVSQAEITKLVSDAATAKAKELSEQFVGSTLPAAMHYAYKLGELRDSYKDEFKDRFDDMAFSKHFESRNWDADPRKAMDLAFEDFVKDKRHQKAIEDAKAQGAKEERDKFSSNNIPGSSAAPEPGPLNTFLQNVKPVATIPDNVRPGDFSLARAAAAELRSEGKS
jgi:hypothetical protein